MSQALGRARTGARPAAPWLKDTLTRRARLLRGLTAGLVLLALVLFVRSLPVEQPLAWLTGQEEALGVWGPVVFGLVFFAATVLLLPATPFVIAAGVLFGPVRGAVLVLGVALASAAVSFLAARYLASRRVAGKVVAYPQFHAVYRALGTTAGWKVVAAVRLSHLLPFGLQNLLFGVTPVRFVPFLLASLVSLLPGMVLYTYLGHVGAVALATDAGEGQPAVPGGWLVQAAFGLVAVVALLYIARLARRILLEHAAAVPAPAVLAEPREPPGWPWATVLGLVLAAALLAASAWWTLQGPVLVRDFSDRWSAPVPPAR
jgi:uncharacterized membrane protein YdjX (TVP38/TMEM64 family)